MRYLLWLICIPLLLEAQTMLLSSFRDQIHTELNGLAKVEADGTLVVDTFGKSGWNCPWKTRPGLLQPHQNYRLRARVHIAQHSQDAHLWFNCRPADNDYLRDTFSSRVQFNRPDHLLDFTFRTDDAEDYLLMLNVKDALKASLSDLRLEKLAPDLVFPITDDVTTEGFAPEPDATGSEEFEVDPPRGAGPVVRAADFGFSTASEDNLPALVRALAECRRVGASRLELAPGDYRCMEGNEPLTLAGLRDFTLDGRGARLVSFRTSRNFATISDCERLVVRDLQLDWDWERDPLASLAQVVGMDDRHFDLKFVHYERFPKRDLRLAVIQDYDLAEKSVGVEGGNSWYLDFDDFSPSRRVEWLSGNVLRVHRRPESLRQGQFYRIQHHGYEMGGFLLENNRHVKLERIRVFGTSGNAFILMGLQHHIHFDQVIIRPHEDQPAHVISCTADHCHIVNSQGFLKWTRCDFSQGADDCINVHDITAFARKTAPQTLTAPGLGHKNRMFLPLTPVELRHGDYSPTELVLPVKSIRKVPGSQKDYEITFSQNLPEPKDEGFVLFCQLFGSRNIIIRDCFFHDHRARGLLLLAHDITVENCRFRHNEMGSIKVETGYTFDRWSEGYGAGNIVVRNCTFEHCNVQGAQNDGFERDIFLGVYLKQDPSPQRTSYPILNRILFENNTFTDTYGLAAFISSAANVTFRGNTYPELTPRHPPRQYRGGFYASHAANIAILNNRYDASPLAPAPTVRFSPETVRGVRISGNTRE